MARPAWAPVRAVALAWFAALAAGGVVPDALHPQVWARCIRSTRGGLSPSTALRRSCVARLLLAFTGAEALYAEWGFRPRSNPAGLVRPVFPALVLNYLGQGALLSARAEAVSNPFFSALTLPGRSTPWCCWLPPPP